MRNPVRVRHHVTFRTDLRKQLLWLTQHRDPDYIRRLREGLDEVDDLLSRFPRAGPQDTTGAPVRKLLLRRLPFVIWYAQDRGDDGDAWMLRLFDARQDRPLATSTRRRGGRTKR
jgi:plasmid stabilization system protein ParE